MQKLLYDNNALKIRRDENGIPLIEADDLPSLMRGMGYCHALDRGMQIVLMRILGRGQASEFLESSDELLEIDLFFRRMNWYGGIDDEISKITPQAMAACRAYCDGINEYISKNIPWEFGLVGYRPDPWKIEDSILLTRMTGYLTMAQSQGDIERLLVEMVRADVPIEKLEELFPGLLSGLDVELIKKLKISQTIIPDNVLWGNGLPRFTASNNWVVAGAKTASGKPILANDPHLETNRLPNIWYETAFDMKGRFAMGATMPGVPALLIGRASDLAWGATYSFMDSVDSWIEHCKDGKRRSGENGWKELHRRVETIKRKGKSYKTVTFYDSEHGTLDGNPHIEGYYLSTRWSGATAGAASLNASMKMWEAKNVEEGMEHLGELELSFNWVLADRHGNIGYQMSGLMPRRGEHANGFIPLKGWESGNEWKGFVPPRELPRKLNTEEQFFITANNDLNRFGKADPINMPMGEYRADRIKKMLSATDNMTPEDIFKIQMDVYSLQAEKYMEILRPLLPDTTQGGILKSWDMKYDSGSEGAYLFEKFYLALYYELFGKNGLGEEVIKHLKSETGIITGFFGNFDRVALSETSAWFGGKSREDIFKGALEMALATKPKKWGEAMRYEMTNIFFNGKLPRFLGFDIGPVSLYGGRATIHQGQIYSSRGRTSSYCPSYRMVADFAEEHIHTNLAGGVSDRRFSSLYCNDFENWLNGKYKKVKRRV